MTPQNFSKSSFQRTQQSSALYLIKGNPMLAELRSTDACFEEIAVTISLGNSTREVFAHPVSKILVEAGTHVPCSSLMPVVHYLHPVTSLDQDITDSEGLSGQWFSFNPHPTLHAPLERMSALIPFKPCLSRHKCSGSWKSIPSQGIR